VEIFVTGGTGVLGRATVPRLVAAGHRVRGASRSPANDDTLRRLGAVPVRTDLFDPAAVRAAVAGSEAVLHLATRIPPTREAARADAWRENDRLRREGTRTLVDAALATGVRVFVYPSVVFVYPDGGDGWLDAGSTPPAADPPPILRSTLAAEGAVARFTAGGGRGVVLRMGAFYGPEAGHTQDALRLARRGFAVMLGSGDGYQSSVWVEDAAAAVVAAVERAPAGVYDVVDDEPLRRKELAAAMAAAVGRRRLRQPPAWLVGRLAGSIGASLAPSQRVANRRFKEATGWAPTVPSARDGWRRLGEIAAGSDLGPAAPAWVRAALAVLVVFALPVGVWQQLFPRSFYTDFPGFGRVWVSVDGPYNEHLIRDVGGGTLALAVVALIALVRPTRALVGAAAVATLVAQVPHTIYHLGHLALLPTPLDRLLHVLLLPLLVLVGAVLLGWAALGRRPGGAPARGGERETERPGRRALPEAA